MLFKRKKQPKLLCLMCVTYLDSTLSIPRAIHATNIDNRIMCNNFKSPCDRQQSQKTSKTCNDTENKMTV